MSNRMFQNVINQMKDAIGKNVGVIDENGVIVACSDIGKIGESRQRVKSEISYVRGSMAFEGYTYRYITGSGKNEYVVFVEGVDAISEKTAEILSVAVGNIKSLYDEKYDKGSFIKNIILDNILPSDIYIKSNELHFNSEEQRAVLVVKFQSSVGTPPYEVVQALLEDASKHYVINISELDIVIVKEVEDSEAEGGLEDFARSLMKRAKDEFGARILVGISSIVDNLKDLARAYKEARIALEVGKVFDIEKKKLFLLKNS